MIDFYTWDGKLVRRLMTAVGVLATDDGRLYVDHDGKIFETQGGLVGVVADWDRLPYPVWADDGAHICGIATDSNGMHSLEVVGIHGDVRRYSLDPADQYPVLSACSFTSGRAAIQTNLGRITGGNEVKWVVRVLALRDGTPINTVTWAGEERTNIVLSRDAQWLARQILRPGHWLTEVVDLTDGSTKASYEDALAAAFSPDDRLLVVGIGSRETRVLDWRTGRVVWSRTTYGTYSGLSGVEAISDAATDKLLVAQSTDNPSAFHAREFWIVDGQGSARPFYPVP
jgi:WD40 repeat protein